MLSMSGISHCISPSKQTPSRQTNHLTRFTVPDAVYVHINIPPSAVLSVSPDTNFFDNDKTKRHQEKGVESWIRGFLHFSSPRYGLLHWRVYKSQPKPGWACHWSSVQQQWVVSREDGAAADLPGSSHRSSQGHKAPATIAPLLGSEQQPSCHHLTLSDANFPLGGRIPARLSLFLAFEGMSVSTASLIYNWKYVASGLPFSLLRN